jgi:hypothetical protein
LREAGVKEYRIGGEICIFARRSLGDGGKECWRQDDRQSMFAMIESDLYRFPAMDPPSFRRDVEAIFPP